MEFDDLVDYWGTPNKAALAMGIDRRRVDQWKKQRIPTRHQLKAEILSDGKLKPDAMARAEARELKLLLGRRAA